MALFLFSLFAIAFSDVYKIEGELEALIYKSIREDKYNEITCKRPSVKELVHKWDNYQDHCFKRDPNDYL